MIVTLACRIPGFLQWMGHLHPADAEFLAASQGWRINGELRITPSASSLWRPGRQTGFALGVMAYGKEHRAILIFNVASQKLL